MGELAVMIPIVAIICGSVIAIAKMFFKSRVTTLEPGDLAGRVNAMEQEIANLRDDLSQAQERIDFTERLLAKQKDAGRLGAG